MISHKLLKILRARIPANHGLLANRTCRETDISYIVEGEDYQVRCLGGSIFPDLSFVSWR